MEYRSSGRYIRISPRRARDVLELVRGLRVEEALSVLQYTHKKASRILQKIIKSGVANAEEQNVDNVDELFIARGWVDEGPTQRRFRPRAMGRATRIRKRTSHITVILQQDGVQGLQARSIRRRRS